MGATTGIAWTDHTFNPWWGCQRVSPGCANCYAEHLSVVRRKLPVWGPPTTTERKRTVAPWKDLPKWNAAAQRDGVRRRVFCASMADIFEDHPQVAPWRAEALALLEACTCLDVQLLTKRPENVRAMVPEAWLDRWPVHVWMGCTVEDQRRADERIPHLLRVPAAVRFLSCEPLLEPLNLEAAFSVHDRYGEPSGPRVEVDGSAAIGQVIVGGESGSKARPFDLMWARSILAQCEGAGVAAFIKQLGDHPVCGRCGNSGAVGIHHGAAGRCPDCEGRAGDGRLVIAGHHGADPRHWPAWLRVQQFPGGHPSEFILAESAADAIRARGGDRG